MSRPRSRSVEEPSADPLVLRPRCWRGRVAGWLAPVGMEFGAEPVTVGVIDLVEYAQRLGPCPVGGGGVT